MTLIHTHTDAQVGFVISSQPVMVNGQLSIDGLVMQIKNKALFNGECELRIYSDRFQQDLLARSKKILLQEAVHSFDLNEIFSSSNFAWEKVELNSVCFQLVAIKQNMPLGLSCFEIVPYEKRKKDKVENEKLQKVKKVFSASLSYQFENIPVIKNVPDRHILDYNGELNLKGIPFKFQGYVQSNKDPFFDQSFSNGRIFFDLNEWKEILIEKLRPKLESQLDSMLQDYPAYDAFKSRSEYIEKLMKDPSYLEDLKELDGLKELADELGVSEETSLDDLRKEMELELKNERDKLIEKGQELSSEKLDSIVTKVNSLESKIEKINSYKILSSKQKAFDNLESLQSEAAAYIGKAETLKADYESKVDSILNDPDKLNKLLKKEGLDNPIMYFTNYVSTFEVGTIQPDYSELILQNSFLRGVNLGFDFGKIGATGFYGRSNSRNRNFQADSTFTANKIIGLKVNYDRNENQKNSLFFVGSMPKNFEGLNGQISVLGYNSTFEMSDHQAILFDVAFHQPFQNSKDQKSKFGENAAFSLNYKMQSKNSKFSTSLGSRFFGPSFQDIDNPFLINNSIEFNGNVSYELMKGINVGLNSLLQENEVYENTGEQKRKLFSNGVSISIKKEKYPFFNYVYNYLENDLTNFGTSGHLHSLNLAKAFDINDVSIQMFAQSNFIQNSSSTDSLNNSNLNLFISQEIIWSEKFRTTLAYNKQEFSSISLVEEQESFVLKIPMRFKNINVSPGMQYLKKEDDYEFGFSLEALINIWEEMNVTVNANSHSFYSYLDDDTSIKTQYTPEINLRLNYRF